MKIIFSLILIAIINFAGYAQNIITGKVIKISDGDTFTLLKDNLEQVRVRLDGIDCPEKNQEYGNKAKEILSWMIWDKKVYVKIYKYDRYSRAIAKVYTDEIEDVNFSLLSLGLAWHYKKYNSNPEYDKAEKYAQKNKLGLWQDKNPIAPWDFRKGIR